MAYSSFTAGVSDFVCSAAVSGTAGARVDQVRHETGGHESFLLVKWEDSSRQFFCPYSVTRGRYNFGGFHMLCGANWHVNIAS